MSAAAAHAGAAHDAAVTAFAAIVQPPPPPLPLRDFASRLRFPDGPRGPRLAAPQGDPIGHHLTPVQQHVLDVLSDDRYQVVDILKPVQGGWSTMLQVWIAWLLAERQRSVAYALPASELMESIYRTKARPLLAQIDGLLPAKGPGSEAGVPPVTTCQSGAHLILLTGGGKNEARQAGVTVPILVIDESDSFKRDARERLLQRIRAWLRHGGRVVLLTTIKHDQKSPTEERARRGPLVRPHYACVRCAAWQTWEPERLSADLSDPQAAQQSIRLACRDCQHPHTPEEHQQTLAAPRWVSRDQTIAADGTVTGPAPAGPLYSLRVTALDDELYDLREYALRWQQAHEALETDGDHDPMRQLHRDYLVRGYETGEEALYLRETALARRSAESTYQRGTAPAEADFCVVGIDVQKRGLWWQVLGWCLDDSRWWILDDSYEPVCGAEEEPTAPQRHAAYDRVAARVLDGYARPDGRVLIPRIGGIDTADGTYRDETYDWLAQRPGWYGWRGRADRMLGADASGSALYRLPGTLTLYQQTHTQPPRLQVELMVDQLKGEVVRGLSRAAGHPGAGHLYAGLAADSLLIRHLVAERLEQTATGPRWIQVRTRNDQFDLAAANIALARWAAHQLQLAQDAPTPDPTAVAAAAAAPERP